MPFYNSALYPPNARCGTWIARSPDWRGWQLNHAILVENGLVLDPTNHTVEAGEMSDVQEGTPGHPGTGFPTELFHGSAAGPVVETHYPFTDLVASWNALTPPGSRVEVQVRVRVESRWSSWFIMGRWAGSGKGSSVNGQENQDGRVDVDTLILHHPASACQVRTFLAGQKEARPSVSLVSLCWSNAEAPHPAAPPVEGNWVRVLRVPRYSQKMQPHKDADSICSPTSLAMVLGYCGVHCSPMDVVAGVHDSAADMYGNWPLNTAYAAARGCPAYVSRFWCMEQLQNEIARGRPVEASIRFGRGELDGAPINYSRGHLVVVVGFTPLGDPVVNDPAARSAEGVERVYKRQQFERAWLGGSGGVVYLVEPRGLSMDPDLQ